MYNTKSSISDSFAYYAGNFMRRCITMEPALLPRTIRDEAVSIVIECYSRGDFRFLDQIIRERERNDADAVGCCQHLR